MTRFNAHSDGKVIVPDEPVDLLPGQKLVVTIQPVDHTGRGGVSRSAWLEKALQLSRQMPQGMPEDLAEQHDHYAHGTPKR